MGDEEDQEAPFQELDGNQLVEKTAWVRLFVREATKRARNDRGSSGRADSVYQRAESKLGITQASAMQPRPPAARETPKSRKPENVLVRQYDTKRPGR